MKVPSYNPWLNSWAMALGLSPRYVTSFDSSTALLAALARYLHGRSFPRLGVLLPVESLAPFVNALPSVVRQSLYIWGGWAEAIPPGKSGWVRAETAAQWMAAQYPKRRFPAAFIGSSNGAAIHLGAALGIPWLPQTFLVSLRHGWMDPDEPLADIEMTRPHALELLSSNPDLQIHQMRDPSQDRLMLQRMSYFRVKRLSLGSAYERFLRENLEPGGTLILLECQLSWPTTRIGERHLFQHGGVGGITPEEYIHGSTRVGAFLARSGSRVRRWEPPLPDAVRPEAEWGFEPSMREDAERFARQEGYKIKRIVFTDPEDLSPFVADLYRWWYGQRGITPSGLLVESFILLEPWWTLRTASVPFWSVFNAEPSADALDRYLDMADPYDEIRMMLFSHGADSLGLASIDRWRAVLGRAKKYGGFVGVDEQRYPRDFGTFARYHEDLKQIPHRYPMPEPLTLSQIDKFVAQSGNRYAVQWI